MHGELIPILITMTVFAYLGWRKYLDHQQRLEALRRGVDPKEIAAAPEKEVPKEVEKTSKAPCDYRLSSMIWIAVGVAIFIAFFFSVGMTRGPGRGLAVAVWGLIPAAIGVARLGYHAALGEGEAPDPQRRSGVVLMAVGATYMICITLSTGMIRGAERGLAVGVWGIIPFAIGMVMFIYSGMVRRERGEQGNVS